MDKRFIWILVFLVMTSFTTASLSDGLYTAWNMEQDPSSSDLIDQVGNNDSTSDDVQGTSAGINNLAWDFELSSSDDVQLSTWAFHTLSALSVSCWFKPETLVTSGSIINGQKNGIGETSIVTQSSAGIRWTVSTTAGQTNVLVNSLLTAGSWSHTVMTYNGTATVGYFDGSYRGQVANTGTVNNPDGLYLGAQHDGAGQFFDGLIDECYLWNRALSPEEVTELYNGGTGSFYPFTAPATSLTVNLISPIDDQVNNTLTGGGFKFNLTMEGETSIDNCNLFTNETGSFAVEEVGSSLAVNTTLQLAHDWPGDGSYIWNINCSTATASDWGTTNRTITIDTAGPSSYTNFINQSILMNNFTWTFNFTDTLGLHTVNITIDSTVINYTTGIGTQSYLYNSNFDLNDYFTEGWHNLTTYVADGHTAKKLKDKDAYNPTNGFFNNYIEFNFKKPYTPGKIKIASKINNIFDEYTTEYDGDRYKINFKPNNIKSNYAFKITTTEEIFIYNSDNYAGDWAVFGEHWIDFYIPGEKNLNVKINKIDKYEAEVLVSGVSPGLTELNFNSVGDLNIQLKHYSFYMGNSSQSYTNNVMVGDDQTLYLNVSKDTDITTSASLLYNNTYQTVIKDSFTDFDIYTSTVTTGPFNGVNATYPIIWEYNLTGPAVNLTTHNNASNTVYNYKIDNCTTYGYNALNVSFISLNTFLPVAVGIILTISGDSNYYYASNGTTAFSLCINPSFANQTINFNIQYNDASSNYYGDIDYNLSTVGQSLTLYTQLVSGVTTFTVKDSGTGATIPGAFTTMYRKVNGTFTVIESKYSDITGRVQFNFDSSVEYQFFLSKAGYDPYNFILNPIIFDSYTILMDSTFTVNETWDFDRVGLLHEPSIFYNNKLNNFTFFIHSPYSELINYGYTLTYPGGTSTNTGTSPVGQEFTSILNITGGVIGDQVILTVFYNTTLSGTRNFNYPYELILESSNGTMIQNKNKTYGMGLLERILISVFFVLLVVGVSTLVGQPIAGFALGLLLYIYFVYIGFLPIWLVLIGITMGLILLGSRPDG